MRHSEVDQMDWVSTEKEVKDSQQRIDEKDFRAKPHVQLFYLEDMRCAQIRSRYLR